jgi:trehalose-6-phosphate synthase
MKGLMVYNPFSSTNFHEILDQAICQSPETNEANMKLVYSYVCRNSMTKWISDFLKDLKYSYQLTKPSYYLTLSLGPGLGRV